MRIIIQGRATIQDPPKDIIRPVKKLLTIKNPEIQKKLNMNLSVFGIDSDLRFFEEKDGNLIVPVGALGKVIEAIEGKGHKLTPLHLIDMRTTTVDEEYFSKFNFKGELRKYQKPVGDAKEGNTVGVIQAKTGSGKTVIFTEWILRGKANTMILVNTKELAEQTIEALVEFSNLTRDDIGFIGSGRFEMKPISIGLLQTVTKLKGEEHAKVKKYFGQIVADETHIIAAETYFNAMGLLPARYKWGYSATPEREDGLTDVIFWATGPLIYKVPDEAVAHRLIIPTYRQVETDYYFPLVDTSEYQTMISYMANDEARNQMIVDEFMKKPDSPSVFLCNRTDQVEALAEMIPDCIMLTSKMNKKQREKAMADLRSGKMKNVASTWGLFSTGIDVPFLEGLYVCSPMKSKPKLKQAAGRLMRQAPGKEESFIVDFIDIKIGLLYGQSRTRKRILTNL